MKNYIFFGAWVLNFLFANHLLAEVVEYDDLPNPLFQSFTVRDGLSNNGVFDTAQDSLGYLWVATQDGLNRFDGVKFETFRTTDPNTFLLSDNVTALHIDAIGRLWVGTDGGTSIVDPVDLTYTYLTVNDEPLTIYVNTFESVDDQVWLGTETGLYIVELDSLVVKKIPHNGLTNMGTNHPVIWNIVNDVKTDTVWVATWGGGVNIYDKHTSNFRYVKDLKNFKDETKIKEERNLNESVITALFVDDDRIWIADHQNVITAVNTHCMCKDSVDSIRLESTVYGFIKINGTLGILTANGLYLYDLNNGKVVRYALASESLLGEVPVDIRSAAYSVDGTLWLGTDNSGLLGLVENAFSVYQYKSSTMTANSLASADVTTIQKLSSNHLFVGSATSADLYFLSAEGKLQYDKNILREAIGAFYASSDGTYWLGGDNGLFHLDEKWEIIRHYDTEMIANLTNEIITATHVYSITTDKDGNIIAGLWLSGLLVITADGKVSIQNSSLFKENDISVFRVVEKQNDESWYATDKGLFVKKIKSATHTHSDFAFEYPLEHAGTAKTIVYDIVDGTNDTWLATNQGVFRHDRANKKFVKQPLKLKSNVVLSLAELDGELWIATSNGLYIWDLITEELVTLNYVHGLNNTAFNLDAIYQNSDYILLGNRGGMLRITPNLLTTKKHQASLAWQSYQFKDNNPPILISENSNKINLPTNTSRIIISYFVPELLDNKTRQYRYRLNRNGWVNNDNMRTFSLSNLAAGEYQVQIQYRQPHQPWQPINDDFTVEVPPLWYQTVYAIVSYTVFLLLLVTFLYLRRIKVTRLRTLELDRLVKAKVREIQDLHQERQFLFANLSHELKTPLSLIQAPVQQLLTQTSFNIEHKSLLRVVERSAIRLNELINRITSLSFNEESDELPVVIDLDSLLKETISCFDIAFEQNQFVMKKELYSQAYVLAKKGDIVSILDNLISNALKYTDERKRLTMRTKYHDGGFEFSIENSHEGLSEDACLQTFQRFNRLHINEEIAGFGLGLAYVLELCKNNNWSIVCTSKIGVSVNFTLSIPSAYQVKHSDEAPYVDEASSSMLSLTSKHVDNKTQKDVADVVEYPTLATEPSLLIVDDNPDIVYVLTQLFVSSYTIYAASNGQEAIDSAIVNKPRVIICDVVMPIKDGLSVVKELDNNVSTRHIPIILLTANTQFANKVEALSLGAEDYVTKPFSAKEIQYKVSNIINRQDAAFSFYERCIMDAHHQERLVAKIQKEPNNIANIKLAHDAEQTIFLAKVYDIITNNFDDRYFNVTNVAEQIGLSERQLLRKVKIMTGCTVKALIKRYRLEHTKTLLKKGYPFKKIADTCGFSSVSYFSRAFKEEYKMTPSDFLKINIDDEAN